MFKYKSLIIILFVLLLLNSSQLSSQSSSEHVQDGISDYKSGKYEDALESFTSALKASDTETEIAVTSSKDYVADSEKDYTGTSKRDYTETSEIKYATESEIQTIETSSKKYYAEPLEYQGDEPAKIYLYRGRTYLQLGNKQAALKDFDKAVSLDPTLSEVFFRRALANTEVDPDKACPDLLAAIERGHQSAKELYNLICK